MPTSAISLFTRLYFIVWFAEISVFAPPVRTKWFYTGRFRNTDVNTNIFHGSVISMLKLLHDQEDTSISVDTKTNADAETTSGPTGQQQFYVFNGGIVLHLQANNASHLNTHHEILCKDILALHPDHFDDLNVSISKLQRFRMLLSDDYPAVERMSRENVSTTLDDLMPLLVNGEVGLFDLRLERMIQSEWREIAIGELVSLNFTMSYHKVPPSFDIPENSNEISDGGDGGDYDNFVTEEHHVVYTVDMMGRRSLYSHIWHVRSATNQHEGNQHSSEPLSNMIQDSTAVNDIRIMSFNLWHNNPPSWVYRDPKARWIRYERRLEHFADVVSAEDPDVVALQEVRLDSGFAAPNGKQQQHLNSSEVALKADVGSQVEHLLAHLSRARMRLRANSQSENEQLGVGVGADRISEYLSDRGYQVVYHPAMNMVNRHRLSVRNEEGVMVLSKLPIVGYDAMLLPRSMQDKEDDHQRVVLRVQVQVRTGDGGRGTRTVDVLTTHFSLSSRARAHSANALVEFLVQPYYMSKFSTRLSNVQVLTGDLNAEPHEDAIALLMEPDNYMIKSPESMCGDIHPFVDAWAWWQQQQQQRRGDDMIDAAIMDGVDEGAPQNSNKLNRADLDGTGALKGDSQGDSQGEAGDDAERLGYTFPACQPVKRIDFLMVRNASGDREIDIAACDCEICGHNVRSIYAANLKAAAAVASGRAVPHNTEKLYARILDFKILGKEPSADTAHLVRSREGLGMNDLDSPVWASDHYAVQVRLQLFLRNQTQLLSNAALVQQAAAAEDGADGSEREEGEKVAAAAIAPLMPPQGDGDRGGDYSTGTTSTVSSVDSVETTAAAGKDEL